MNAELAARCEQLGLNFQVGCDGSFGSEIVIIAEAPGGTEVSRGSPLVGGSGTKLWDTLRQYNIKRGDCYITNVIKRQVSFTTTTQSGERATPKKSELEHWENILEYELSCLPNAKYLVLLGNYALGAVVGVNGITHWRGSVVDVSILGKTYQALCAVNPVMVLREPKNELMFRFDLAKLRKLLDGKWEPHRITAHINPSYSQALEYIDHCKSSERVSFDIEVVSNETACVGLATSAHEGMCINFRNISENIYTLEEEYELRLSLQSLLATHDALVAQNGVFDSYWLWYKDRIKVRRVWFDTLLAHHAIYPSLPHNLGFLTAQYTNHPFYKDEGKTWKEGGDIDAFWEYNVKDVCITYAAMMKLWNELRQNKMDKFFFEHVMRLQPHLVNMTVHGVPVDVEQKRIVAAEMVTRVDNLKAEFYDRVAEATGDSEYKPNPNSPQQLKVLYFNKLGLIGRGSSTDRTNRDHMLKHPRTSAVARAVIESHNAYAVDNKFLSTYAEMAIDTDDRVRSEYKQFGTTSAPGRLSSSGVLWGTGTNLQNQPERMHGMYITTEGYEFSYFDMSQIEARLVAYFANIPKWKEQFERARLEPGSYDAHRALASEMFNVPYDEVPKKDRDDDLNPTIRFIAKRCRHGLNYRMGPERLAETTGLTVSEAHRNHAIYHNVTPEIRKWWDATIREVKQTRYLETPYGRRWVLLERFDENALDSIVAFKPQSTAGDHVSSVIYMCHEDPRWPRDARICMNIHDALIAINRIEDGPLVRAIMKEHAERPIPIKGELLIVPAEFKKSEPDEAGVHRLSNLKGVDV